ncbi:hypothetical protein ACFPRL_19170 [Pseudoclavibacter helvolus]
MQHSGVGHAGLHGDLADRRRIEALDREDPRCRIQDLVASRMWRDVPLREPRNGRGGGFGRHTAIVSCPVSLTRVRFPTESIQRLKIGSKRA